VRDSATIPAQTETLPDSSEASSVPAEASPPNATPPASAEETQSPAETPEDTHVSDPSTPVDQEESPEEQPVPVKKPRRRRRSKPKADQGMEGENSSSTDGHPQDLTAPNTPTTDTDHNPTG
jgi:hypothetical protein